MTPKEAWKNIKDDVDFLNLIDKANYSTDDDIKIIDEIVAKAEPMKPKLAWKSQKDEGVVGYRCLNCNGSLGAKLDNKPMFPNFCRHCGQKLDWSDEK